MSNNVNAALLIFEVENEEIPIIITLGEFTEC